MFRVERNPDSPLPPRFDEEPPVLFPPKVPIAVRGTERRPLPFAILPPIGWSEINDTFTPALQLRLYAGHIENVPAALKVSSHTAKQLVFADADGVAEVHGI